MIDNKTPIVYVSGWLGNGKNSGTYRWLEKNFKNIDVFSTDGNTDVKRLCDDLQKTIDKVKAKYGKTPILLANSYGGYIATFMGYVTILINPTIYASETIYKIAEITEDEIKNFKKFERSRDMSNTYLDRMSFFPLISDSDEIIEDNKIKNITSNIPVIVTGGKHKLTDKQRDDYLLPLINRVLELN